MADKAGAGQAGSGGQPPAFGQVPGQQGLPPYPGLGQYPGAPFMGQQGYGAPQPGQGYSVGHEQQLRGFWQEQLREVHQVPCDPAEFKNHQLPLARIKKIMKSDEDVRMISAEAPVLFAKACEMFILELTLRSWYHAEENKRRTLQRNDIAAAITKTDIFDFLIDIVPREELKPEGQDGSYPAGAGTSTTGQTQGGMPPPGMFGYNPYMPPGGAPGAPGMPPMDPQQMLVYSQQYMQSMQQMAGQGWPGAAGSGAGGQQSAPQQSTQQGES